MKGWDALPNPGQQSEPSETASAGPSPGGLTKNGYWDAKEARDLEKDRRYREEDIPAIRRSTAYNCAATLGAAALAGDAISFGSVAKGKRLDMYLGYVDLIAAHVLDRLNGVESLEAEEAPEQQEVTEDE